jgi:His-Xaa-Ser system radical SAM maturase HxsC
MKAFAGLAHGISEPLLGRISKRNLSLGFTPTILLTDEPKWFFGHAGVLTSQENVSQCCGQTPFLSGIATDALSELHEGDIVKIFPDGRALCIWERASEQNVVFVTDKCDCRCIMCPQPPETTCEPSRWQENKRILKMVSPDTKSICFTGGEPTIEIKQLTDLLSFCTKKFPNATLSILTNGRSFSDFEKARDVISAGKRRLLLCISLDGDTEDIHDELVGASGAFGQTMRGLYNLARFQATIELRFVIMRQNYKRLPHYAEFVYRNLPFVAHVAFMGLEYTGEAEKNMDRLLIDPTEYKKELLEAIRILHRREIDVSIYNIPHCLLERDVWNYARDSISAWKKTFSEGCGMCSKKDACCGLFATSKYKSKYLKEIQ